MAGGGEAISLSEEDPPLSSSSLIATAMDHDEVNDDYDMPEDDISEENEVVDEVFDEEEINANPSSFQ